MAFTYRIDPGPEFDRVVAALARVEATMPEKFRDEVEKAAVPLAEKARNKVRAIPTHGKKHTGMRERIAQGVGIKTGGAAFVRITTSMSDPQERTMPRNFDDRDGWRHPVFGTDNWVHQSTGGNWFINTMQDGQAPLEKSLTKVLEDAADAIDRAGGRVNRTASDIKNHL